MSTQFNTAPLTTHIGAVVEGVDLNTIDESDVEALLALLSTHLVLFFRHQDLDPHRLKRLAERLGKPTPYPFVEGLPDYPDVIEVVKRPSDTTNFGGVWHSDTAYLKNPASGALLYGVQIPEAGGDTLFTNMYRVFDALSPGLQAFLRQLSAVNLSDKPAIAKTRPGAALRGLSAEHPVVKHHPMTGLPYLFVNRAHTTRFSGMTEAESAPLLEYLFNLIEQPEFSCRFHWQTDSVAFWDNRSCQHYPLNDYHGQSRRMLRISLAEFG